MLIFDSEKIRKYSEMLDYDPIRPIFSLFLTNPFNIWALLLFIYFFQIISLQNDQKYFQSLQQKNLFLYK